MAIELGHPDVHQHDIGTKGRDGGECALTVECDPRLRCPRTEASGRAIRRHHGCRRPPGCAAARPAPVDGAVRQRRRSLRRRLRGQSHDELAALSGTRAARFDAPAMQLHELPHQREAQARGHLARRSVLPSDWKNISNTRGRSVASIPFPSSLMRAVTLRHRSTSTTRRVQVPSGLYFTALLRRLRNTCVRRTASPSTCTGVDGSVTSMR